MQALENVLTGGAQSRNPLFELKMLPQLPDQREEGEINFQWPTSEILKKIMKGEKLYL